MHVLTPSSFFSFYPALTTNYKCLVRHISGADPVDMWHTVDHALSMNYDVLVDNGNERSPCDVCPSMRRRTCGGRDMVYFVWNAKIIQYMVDDYAETVATRFQLPHSNLIWQFSTWCFNPACDCNPTSVFHHPTGFFTTVKERSYDSVAVIVTDDIRDEPPSNEFVERTHCEFISFLFHGLD